MRMRNGTIGYEKDIIVDDALDNYTFLSRHIDETHWFYLTKTRKMIKSGKLYLKSPRCDMFLWRST
jgi:uncharacterized C2H2 Zn-finger protein